MKYSFNIKVVVAFFMPYFPLITIPFNEGKMSMKMDLQRADTSHILAESDSLFAKGKLCYGKQEYLAARNMIIQNIGYHL